MGSVVRFPLWPYMKLVFCSWLVLPIFNGAAYIYENHVRRYVNLGGTVSSSYSDRQRRVMQTLSLDARKSVERFVDVYGQEAFERVVKAVSTPDRECFDVLPSMLPTDSSLRRNLIPT